MTRDQVVKIVDALRGLQMEEIKAGRLVNAEKISDIASDVEHEMLAFIRDGDALLVTVRILIGMIDFPVELL